jgi:flagellar hook-basal body complex protein FliE
MSTSAISAINPFSLTQVNSGSSNASKTTNSGDFGNFFANAIGSMNNEQVQGQNMVQSLVTGQTDDASSVMVQLEQETLDMQYTAAIRDKAITGINSLLNTNM